MTTIVSKSNALDTIFLVRAARRQQLFRSITLITTIATALAALLFGAAALITGETHFWWLFGTSLIAVLLYSVSLSVAKKSVDVGLYLSLITGLIIISGAAMVFGTYNPGVGTLLWIPLQAGLLSQYRKRDIIIFGVLAVLLMTALVVAEQVLHLFSSWSVLKDSILFTFYIWASLAGMIIAGIIIFVDALQKEMKSVEEKSLELNNSLEKLKYANQLSQDMSYNLKSVVSELGATSQQQASGASQQVSALVEATSSLQELGETAQHIASNSSQVAQAAEQCLSLAKEVEARSESLNNLTEQGKQSVSNVITVIEAVRSRIESLAQRLLILTERSKEIGNIIDLMREIADETHLLALNAAIESNDGRTTSKDGGRRFGVIAGEVKNLADRSLEAAQDVQKVIVEVQSAIATAVLAAEEGKKETVRAVNQAYTSGQVISELGRAAVVAVQSSTRIVEAVSKVRTLSEEITLATRQQGSASEQIVLTMQTVQEVAREGASSATQISSTISLVEDLVVRVQQVLNEQKIENTTTATVAA